MLVKYWWVEDGETEICRVEQNNKEEYRCYHCDQIRSGKVYILSPEEDDDKYTLCEECFRKAAEEIPNAENLVLLPDDIGRSHRYYGGESCGKLGIIWQGECFILKVPKRATETMMPLSEHIGSRIYEALGVPVQETFMAEYHGKIGVCCKDFRKFNEQFWEFSKLKTSMPFITDDGYIISGLSTELSETLSVIKNHPDLEEIRGPMEERFWDMFVVDALIGNPGRNNRSWGVISDGHKMRLAPVYGNGESFHFEKHDRKIERILKDADAIRKEAFKNRICCFEENNGEKINPYQYILSGKNEKCNEAVLRIVPRINLEEIFSIIDNTPAITDIRAEFCKMMIQCRVQDVLQPAYKKLKLQTPKMEPQKHDKAFPWNEEVVLVSGKNGNLVRVEELAKELGIEL